MGGGSVVAKIGRGLYDERRRITVPRRRRVDHALRDHLDTYLEDPVDGDVVHWDAASRNWLAGNPVRPICLITNAFGSHQPVPPNVDTAVTLGHARIETFAGMHVGSTIVVPAGWGGIYEVSYSVQWEDFNDSGKPGGYRSSHVRVDGTTFIDDHRVWPEISMGVNLTMYASRPVPLAAGDVVDLIVLQDNTVDDDNRLLHQTGERPHLSIAYLGPSS